MILTTFNGKEILVDDDFDMSHVRWGLDKEGYPRHCLTGYPRNRVLHLHRYIMKAKKGECVDHINGNILDNRRSNLRICTNAQNRHNSDRPSVWHDTKRGLFIAKLSNKGKSIYLGQFLTREDAIRAWLTKKIELHGEFASRAIAKWGHLLEPDTAWRACGVSE